MGQEISRSRFHKADFERYQADLARETALLARWFADGAFVAEGAVGGFELEAWLVDRSCLPAPINEEFLARLHSDWVCPELARFNVELNVAPETLRGAALRRLEAGVTETWARCRATARALGADLVMIGILPSVRAGELVLANMSRVKRYRALNEQVFRQRRGRPLRLEIVGRERLRTSQRDVMLESAATSFQVHLQVRQEEAVRVYNASLIASAATVALAANAPYLFGIDLWDETRIPLFEQAVAVGGYEGAMDGPLRRVGFGSGYARESLFECFQENLDHYPVLLPMHFEGTEAQMEHLRLHNGTIWRWTRPLVGFDERARAHLRIEHRVMAAGPTVADLIANAAFCFGLLASLARMPDPPEHAITFADARDNFYTAARNGLNATVTWLGGRRATLRTLLLDELLGLARAGLEAFEIDGADIETYLGIVEARARSARTGAAWQRAWVERYGRDMRALTAAYAERQNSARPVHEWDL